MAEISCTFCWRYDQFLYCATPSHILLKGTQILLHRTANLPPNLEIRVPPWVQLGGYSLYMFKNRDQVK